MGTEHKAVKLRGIRSELQKYVKLGEIEYSKHIAEIGERIAGKLNRFTRLVNSEERLSNRYVFWDFVDSDIFDGRHEEEEQFGLYLECGDFYVDKIYFIGDIVNPDTYVLSIHGGSNFESDLFSYPDSELQLLFITNGNTLVFNEVLLLGYQGHEMVLSQLEIEDQSKLKIMLIADRAMRVFTRMELVKYKSTLENLS